MNVKPGVLAMLARPLFPENKGRICTVVQACSPTIVDGQALPCWICHFPSPVMTTIGEMNYTTTEDWRLVLISDPDSFDGDQMEEDLNKQLELTAS